MLKINKKWAVICLLFLNVLFPFVFFNFGNTWLNQLGVICSYFVLFLAIKFVDEQQKSLDSKLLKLFQPFLICFYSVILAFNKLYDYSIIVITGCAYFVSSLLLIEDTIQRAILRYKRLKIYLVLSALLLILGCLVVRNFKLIESFVISEKSLFKAFYFLLILIFLYVGTYKSGIKEVISSYRKSYFIQKISTITLLCNKLFLFFGYFNSSQLFQIIYVVNAVIFILSFRHKKENLIIASLSLLVLEILPGKMQALTIDPGVISFIVMMFYLRSPILYQKENKYGELYVYYDYKNKKKVLLNNRVLHGVEDVGYKGGECRHQYYTGLKTRNAFYSLLKKFSDKPISIGVVGMGIGMLASLVETKQKITFFEINPTLKDLALKSGIFNYIKFCKGQVKIDIGHARQELQSYKKDFDLLIIDAYTGGEVVPEFLTEEAFNQYFRGVLKSGGAVLIHLTSSAKSKSMIYKVAKKLGLQAKISYHSTDDNEEINIIDRGYQRDQVSHARKMYDFILSGVNYLSIGNLFNVSRSSNIVWAVIYKEKKFGSFVEQDSRWHDIEDASSEVSVHDEDVGYEKGVQITDVIS
ncbi:MAG: hypothetical protein RLN62_00030 [Rickettsiales bacterium]